MKPLVIIAGIGQSARELVVRLSENWRVLPIDREQRKYSTLALPGE